MSREEKFEFIEAFLAGKTEGQQIDPPEDEVEMEEEIRFHRDLHEAIHDKDLQRFEQKVKEAEKVYFQKQQSKRKRIYWAGLSIAAALLLFLGIRGIFQAETSGPELYEAFYQPYQAPAVFRSEGQGELDPDLMLALVAYRQMDYEAALNQFNAVLNEHPEQDLALFLQAICFLELDSSRQAQQGFKGVVSDNTSLFREQAYWYAALDLVRQNKFEKAKEFLQRIPKDERAIELLNKLPNTSPF